MELQHDKKMKTIVIFGANGFLGRVLSRYFLEKNWKVIGVARRTEGMEQGVEFMPWDGENLAEWTEGIERADVVVNLTGRTVNCRYNAKNRAEILDSRVNSTKVVGLAIEQAENPPEVWLNASTGTIYRDARDYAQTDEDGEIGEGFSVEIGKAWEKAFFDAPAAGVRKVALRTAMVLGEEPDTVWKVLQGLADKGLGGKMGDGKQMVSWLSDIDFARIVDWMIEKEGAIGTYNVTSPEPISNAELMTCVRDSVGMSFGLPATNWMLEIGAIFMRTETELILKSRWTLPTKLQSEGFVFKHPNLREWAGVSLGKRH